MRVVKRLLLDILLPVVAFAAVAYVFMPALSRHLDTWTALSSGMINGDAAGTIWFYWWVSRAISEGLPMLWSDATCAPAGEFIGMNFPSRVDAWLAAPFFMSFALPRSLNLFVLSLPAINGLAAYGFLRTLTTRRLVAFGAALPVAFNTYSAGEVFGGRPVTALVAPMLLFFALWRAGVQASAAGSGGAGPGDAAGAELGAAPFAPLPQTRRWSSALVLFGWAAAAGISAAVVVHSYIPAVLPCAVFAGLTLLSYRPPWRRALGLIAGSALIAGLGSAPYVHEVVVVRPTVNRTVTAEERSGWASWNPGNWGGLIGASAPAGNPLPAEFGGAPVWEGVQTESLDWNALWTPSVPIFQRAAWVWPGMLVIAGLIGAVGGRRGWGWLFSAGVVYSLTVGPNLGTLQDGALNPLLWGGERVPTPLRGVLAVAPGLASWIKPYRWFPIVVLCLSAAWVVGLQRLAEAAAGRWPRHARFTSPAVGLGSVVLGVWVVAWTAGLGGLVIRPERWSIPEGIRAMAEDPEPYMIAEVPSGGGHTYGILQAVHGKARNEPMHDLPDFVLNDPPPRTCYTTPFAEAIWWVGNPAEAAQQRVAQTLAASAPAAREQGFKYVLFYPALQLGSRAQFRDLALAQRQLVAAFGPPAYKGREVEMYALESSPPSSVPDVVGPAVGGDGGP